MLRELRLSFIEVPDQSKGSGVVSKNDQHIFFIENLD
jgi:hypothetical protein